MFKNPWNDCVAKVEHDHRAREARLRLEGSARTVEQSPVGRGIGLVRLVRRLSLSVSGSSGTDDDSCKGSTSGQGNCGIAVAVPFPAFLAGGVYHLALSHEIGIRRAAG